MEKPKNIPLMVRLPAELHAEVQRFAVGNGKRPKASLNDALIFLVRLGLETYARRAAREEAEPEPGQLVGAA